MGPIELPLLVLTGAGVSQESGVPTFRGADGLWKRYRAEELATPEALATHPQLVWEWYDWRRTKVSSCRPNAAHQTIVEMERWAHSTREGSFLLVTQNVDGLHELAGSRSMETIHGSIWELRCVACSYRRTDRQAPLSPLPPFCPDCRSLLRPGVVLFGESLDSTVLETCNAAAAQARTVVVVGTSALVYPAANLPLIALENGARLIEINLEDTPLSPLADDIRRGPAGRELPRWWSELGHGPSSARPT